MQNKGAIQTFAILLALACVFHLSFTFITQRTEAKAMEEAGGDVVKQRAILDSIGNDAALDLGLFSVSYNDAKRREMNLGLDLRGGINVTVEVSISDLLRKMANNPNDPAFEQAIAKAKETQKTSQEPFVDLFANAYQEANPGARLAAPGLFGHANQKLINGNMSNEEVLVLLRNEADMALSRTFEVLDARINNFGMTQASIQKVGTTGRIRVELPGVQNETHVRELIEKPAKLEFWETYEAAEVLNRFGQIDELLRRQEVAESAAEDVDTSQTETPDSVSAEENPAEAPEASLAANAPDLQNPELPEDTSSLNTEDTEFGGQEDLGPLFRHFVTNIVEIEGQAQYGFGPTLGYTRNGPRDTMVLNRLFARKDVKGLLPPDLKLAWGNKAIQDASNELIDGQFALIALRSNSRDGSPAMEGDVVVNARFQNDENSGGFEVVMEMNADGARDWAKLTEKNVNKSVAIVLDGRVYSYPNVNEKIAGGISSISGNFGLEEAKALASILKSGKLPARNEIVEMAIVGPSLGSKARAAGISSLAIAFLLVLLYMAFYYGKAGITADLALFTNLFFLLGALAGFGTTLTLPGITGIVLTIGMSVDANVLIYERIREELRAGKGVKMALADGYKRAYRAIIDSNITTALIALVLIVFGAGPVRGFAITLNLGILTSLFSAIFITRLLFEWQLNKNRSISFSSKATEKLFSRMSYDFVGKRKPFYIVSAALMLAGFVSFATKGFNLGVDLNGGRSYVVAFDNSDFSTSEVSTAVTEAFGGASTQVKYYGDQKTVLLVSKYKIDDQSEEVDNQVKSELFAALSGFYTNPPSEETFVTINENKPANSGIERVETVGPTMARDVAIKSIWAVVISLIIMFAYILLRFRGWQYGLGALAALVHDVVLVLAVFSIFDGILPFSLEIDQAIIAAVLTVIGYSINDTVIIFDRIREYVSEARKGTMGDMINNALNSTMGRTVNTSMTVLFVLLVAFLFGGEGIRGLSFAVLIGVLVGTYSSIFIASPIVLDLQKKKAK